MSEYDTEKQSLLNKDIDDFDNVSTKKKLGWILLASLFLFFSGVLIGFVPIKSVILDSKIYSELDIDLGMVISMTLMSIITYPTGLFLDRFGSRTTAIFAAFTQMIGHLLVAFCFVYSLPVVVFIIALALDSLANPFVFVSILQFTRLFANYDSFLMGYFTGLWDLSALLGFLILLAHNYGIHISITFWVSGSIYLIFMILIFFIFPKNEIPKYDHKNDISSKMPIDNNMNEYTKISSYDDNKNTISNGNNTLLIITIFAASANIISMNFYIINFHNLLLVWDKNSDTDIIINAFSLAFPCIGFVGAILSGGIIQKFGLKRSIICMTLFQFIFCIMSLIPTYCIHSYAFFPYIFYRMMLYTSLNVCVSNINPHKIGQNLGLVYGISSVLNLSNYGFSYLATTVNDDYFGYYWIHIGMILLALITSIFWICFQPK